MKAVVLAAGKGERLIPLTESHPKHLLPIGGKPILEWTFQGLKYAGIDETLVVTHYKEKQIREYFSNDFKNEMTIKLIKQPRLKGTADAFGIAKEFTEGEPFLGLYGDLYVSPKVFKAILEFYKKGDTVMSVVPVEDPSGKGIVEIENHNITRIVEKPLPGSEPSNLANAGVYVFDQKIFDWIHKTELSRRNEYEITDSINLMINSGSIVKAFKITQNDWVDIGHPWNLLEANELALQNLEPHIKGKIEKGAQLVGPLQIMEGTRIRSGSYIEGPVYIGSGSDIGPNCYIRPSTSIGADVRIGNACEVKNSIIMDGTHIAHLSYVGDSIIGERCNLGAGTITANIRFDKKNIKVKIKNNEVDSGKRKLGAILGDNVQTGINVSLLPGVKIGSESWVAPGLSVYEDIDSGVFKKVGVKKNI